MSAPGVSTETHLALAMTVRPPRVGAFVPVKWGKVSWPALLFEAGLAVTHG
jgi:hypothetical protein